MGEISSSQSAIFGIYAGLIRSDIPIPINNITYAFRKWKNEVLHVLEFCDTVFPRLDALHVLDVSVRFEQGRVDVPVYIPDVFKMQRSN